MMREVKDPRQIASDPRRRIFNNDKLQLVLWISEQNEICGFQLCYEIGKIKKALTWWLDEGFTHKNLDDGENRVQRSKMTPVLTPNGIFPFNEVYPLFVAKSYNLDPVLRDFIKEKLRAYPED